MNQSDSRIIRVEVVAVADAGLATSFTSDCPAPTVLPWVDRIRRRQPLHLRGPCPCAHLLPRISCEKERSWTCRYYPSDKGDAT